ncbi:MAG: hypothetical protein EON98_15355 [Chitinophagaceae bacterium]|nr:MAG: hypothetical protein EON98_15355 [Chitinophagaceae bacterium]
MRIAALIFIILAVGANFYFNNLTSLVVAMFSFPVLVWVLLRRRRKTLPMPKQSSRRGAEELPPNDRVAS